MDSKIVYFSKSFLSKQKWFKIISDFLDYDEKTDNLDVKTELLEVCNEEITKLFNNNNSNNLYVNVIKVNKNFEFFLYINKDNKIIYPNLGEFEYILKSNTDILFYDSNIFKLFNLE